MISTTTSRPPWGWQGCHLRAFLARRHGRIAQWSPAELGERFEPILRDVVAFPGASRNSSTSMISEMAGHTGSGSGRSSRREMTGHTRISLPAPGVVHWRISVARGAARGSCGRSRIGRRNTGNTIPNSSGAASPGSRKMPIPAPGEPALRGTAYGRIRASSLHDAHPWRRRGCEADETRREGRNFSQDRPVRSPGNPAPGNVVQYR